MVTTILTSLAPQKHRDFRKHEKGILQIPKPSF